MTRTQRLIRDVAVVAMVFQLVHLIEHTAQLTYWFAHPTDSPWLTPWAAAGRDVLVVDGTAGSGNEILHLLGNVIFFGGLVALSVIAHNAGRKTSDVRYLREALIIQGIHVGEHVMLTLSYLAWGSAVGFTTLFGTASGAFGSGLRVWAHFVLNLAASYFALRATWEMYRNGLFVKTGQTEHARRISTVA